MLMQKAYSVITPSNVVTYNTIILTNNQNAAVAPNTPIMFTINALEFQLYETNSLNNTELFYANGTIIPSWIEGNTANILTPGNQLYESNSVAFWFRSPATNTFLSANTGMTNENVIYLGFAGNVPTPSNNLMNNYLTGEAPQLTSSYAQYDNGANVFTFYDNFAGNTLDSSWNAASGTSGTDYAVNNGFYLLNTNTRILSTSNFIQPAVLEGFVYFITGPGNCQSFGVFASTSNAFDMCTVGNPWGSTWYYNEPTSGYTEISGSGHSLHAYFIWQIKDNQYSVTDNYDNPDYSTLYTVTYTNHLASAPIRFGDRFDNGFTGETMNEIYYWIRTRTYPPNGIMPTIAFGSNTISTPTISVNANEGAVFGGQAFTATTSFSGGTPPYTYNWIVTNSVTGAIIANQLYTNVITMSDSFAFTPNTQTIGNTIQVNVIVTDANLVTANSVKSATVTIYSTPQNIVSYIPITINNAQNGNVPSPFQQMIVFNSSNYTSVESKNLQNIEFFNQSGSIIPSWLESNNTNTSTGTIYWLKLTNSILGRSSDMNSILPNGNATVYMGFASLTTNLFSNTMTGEAPQLSSTYAQYDTGANVFTTFYDDFAGNTVSSSTYNIIASSHISQNNGFILSTNGGYVETGIITNNGFIPPFITDSYVTGTSGVAGMEIQSGNTISNGGYQFSGHGCSVDIGSMSSLNCNNAPHLIIGYGVMGGTWNSSSSQTWYYNYTAHHGTNTNYALPSKEYVALGTFGSNPGILSVQWLRIRAFPPNAIMPSVTFGTTNTPVMPTITPTGHQVIYGNANTILSFTSSMRALSPPYTYNWIAVNTITGTTIANALYTGVSSTTNTFTFKTNAQMDGNTIQVNLTVTDSKSVKVNSIKTETIMISNVITPSGIVTYIPITINNAQGSATQSPFQEMITVNSMNYTSIESGNLDNVEFFNMTGAVIPSWLESNNTNTSTGTIYWVKLTNSILGIGSDQTGIQAHTNVTIFMGFAQIGTNLFSNTMTGEAPQLSSTYAQYDNGANVFTTFYDNFEGTSISAAYNQITPASLSQNNGITYSSGGYGGIITNNGFTPPFISDVKITSLNTVYVGMEIQTGNTAASSGYLFDNWGNCGQSVSYGSMEGQTQA
ncbi:MAG: hypothetical protein KGI06_01085, partial [Candidatus Micrarchaeota archaeon]|nr:hypothetical protein [Candidatus Micrarchaeota archaeon]